MVRNIATGTFVLNDYTYVGEKLGTLSSVHSPHS